LRPSGRTHSCATSCCVSPLDGVTFHGATRAGAHDLSGARLLRYVLRPPIAEEHLEQRDDAMLCITFKRPTPTGRWQPTWTRCRHCAAWPRASLHHACTPSYAGMFVASSEWMLAPASPVPRSPRATRPPGPRPRAATARGQPRCCVPWAISSESSDLRRWPKSCYVAVELFSSKNLARA
jgi:hypothetical protein